MTRCSAGRTGQTYYGCRFPAAPEYAPTITEHAVAIADELSRQGVVGRFGVDFVVTRRAAGWATHAVEINLRSGGTTHPYLALLALTSGTYDPVSATFLADGVAKHYVASDHIETEHLERLTPDDVLDVITESAASAGTTARARGACPTWSVASGWPAASGSPPSPTARGRRRTDSTTSRRH